MLQVNQSVLHAAGPRAASTEHLWWFAFIVSAVVYVLTVGALFWAIGSARRRERDGQVRPDDAHDRMTRGVGAGIAASVVILLVYLG